MAFLKDVNVNGRTVFDTNNLLVYLTDYLKTDGGKYVAGLGFVTNNYLDEFQLVKVTNQKTAGRQFRQITIVPSPAGSKLSHEQYMEMGQEIAQYYYIQGYQVLVTMHIDTDTIHFHLMLNSVNFRTGKMFSQSKSELNRFKLHCNHIFDKYGLDLIGKPVEMMIDTVVHEMSEGFECLELFDEIIADKASSLSDLYKEPVAEHQPLYTPEYTMGDCIVCAPTQTRNYFNPDAPKPWTRIVIHPDGSLGIPTYPLDEIDMHIISFMSPELRQRVLSIYQQRPYYRRQVVSGKQFAENPTLFLNNSCEINIIIESDAERENVIAVLGRLRRMAEAERAYNTKLGVASVAQLDQLGVAANVTTDNSTTLNVTIKGKDGTEETAREVIDLPCEDDKNN